jgi:hypothetical protein
MSHTSAQALDCCGFSEHSPLESFSGSIGMTRRGKYTRGGAVVGLRVQRLARLARSG